MKVALFYGTSTGNTENVASYFDDLSPEIELVTYIDDFKDADAYDGL
jgi:flavodoxin